MSILFSRYMLTQKQTHETKKKGEPTKVNQKKRGKTKDKQTKKKQCQEEEKIKYEHAIVASVGNDETRVVNRQSVVPIVSHTRFPTK